MRTIHHFGQFVFSKAVLYDKGVISKNGVGGKRAMRIYPPWDKADNLQARKTQAWQVLYFFEIHETLNVNFSRIQRLYGL